jgi:hypothetical protein
VKSNKHHTTSPARLKNPNLRQTLTREKEALVTMFLSNATHMELTQQIKKIDDLCSKIDMQQRSKPLL